MGEHFEEGVLKRQKLNTYNLMVLVMCGFGSISFGYTASIIGTTLGQPSFITYFDLAKRSDGTDLISTMNGLFQAGGAIGTFAVPWCADKWGRKWACAVACIVNVISGAIMTGSNTVGLFIAFRFFAGASAYALLAAVPIMMTEIAPVHIRGILVDIHAVMITIGFFTQGWVGFGFYFWKTESLDAWRGPMAIQCFWPLCFLLGLYFMPESPRWLCLKGRDAEAEQVLFKLHADPNDVNNDVARAEFYQIRKQIAIDRTLGNSWMSIIKKPSYRKRALLAIATAAIIQFTGTLVINNYGPSLYRNLGYSPVKQLLFPAAWLSVALGGTLLAMFMVDRFSRPKYMAFGAFGCMASLIIEAALVAEFVPSDNTSALQAAVAFLFIFEVFYTTFLDGTQFAYYGEIFPTHLRAKGMSLGVGTIALMNLVWLQSAPVAFENIGWRFYLVFIIPGTIGAVIMGVWFPDTRGLPLEEVAAIFGDTDEVAIYQRDIEVDFATHTIVDHGHDFEKVNEVKDVAHVESRAMK